MKVRIFLKSILMFFGLFVGTITQSAIFGPDGYNARIPKFRFNIQSIDQLLTQGNINQAEKNLLTAEQEFKAIVNNAQQDVAKKKSVRAFLSGAEFYPANKVDLEGKAAVDALHTSLAIQRANIENLRQMIEVTKASVVPTPGPSPAPGPAPIPAPPGPPTPPQEKKESEEGVPVAPPLEGEGVPVAPPMEGDVPVAPDVGPAPAQEPAVSKKQEAVSNLKKLKDDIKKINPAEIARFKDVLKRIGKPQFSAELDQLLVENAKKLTDAISHMEMNLKSMADKDVTPKERNLSTAAKALLNLYNWYSDVNKAVFSGKPNLLSSSTSDIQAIHALVRSDLDKNLGYYYAETKKGGEKPVPPAPKAGEAIQLPIPGILFMISGKSLDDIAQALTTLPLKPKIALIGLDFKGKTLAEYGDELDKLNATITATQDPKDIAVGNRISAIIEYLLARHNLDILENIIRGGDAGDVKGAAERVDAKTQERIKQYKEELRKIAVSLMKADFDPAPILQRLDIIVTYINAILAAKILTMLNNPGAYPKTTGGGFTPLTDLKHFGETLDVQIKKLNDNENDQSAINKIHQVIECIQFLVRMAETEPAKKGQVGGLINQYKKCLAASKA